MLHPFETERRATTAVRLCADRSGLSGGLLVERVFGIKALQRMIDMHGCKQIPGVREPFFISARRRESPDSRRVSGLR
jgi:hypothetical protein